MSNGFEEVMIVYKSDLEFLSGFRQKWLEKRHKHQEFFFAKIYDNLPF